MQGPAYYLHNGSLAFNLALLLALGLPLLAALQHLCRRTITASARSPTVSVGLGADARQSAGQRRKGWQGALSGGGFGVRSRDVAALAPLWLWLTVISLLPHKEERFLYVVYPLVGLLMPRSHVVVSLDQNAATCHIQIRCAALQGSILCCWFRGSSCPPALEDGNCNYLALLLQICLAAALSLGAILDISSAILSLVVRQRMAQQLSRALQLGAHLSDTPFVPSTRLLAYTDGCDLA